MLPEFPQPTHDFPVIDALKIKVKGKDLKPIHTLTGTAPGRYVTIDDAIGDLPLFDWYVPIATLMLRCLSQW